MFLQARIYAIILLVGIVFSAFAFPSNAVSLTKEQIFQMAAAAARDGEYDKSIEFFKKLLEIDPRFAPAYNSLGLVYQARGGDDSVAESVRYFTLAVDVDPNYVESLNNLGRAHYSTGQFLQAERVLLRSLKVRPEQPDIELVLGWVYLIGESRAEKAVEHFEKGLKGLNDDMSHYGIGLAHILMGNKFKVLDQITELRRRHKEDLALKLENMVRGNLKISSRPGYPLITGVDQGKSVFDQELQELTARGFNAGEEGKGIQVRLKGSLAE